MCWNPWEFSIGGFFGYCTHLSHVKVCPSVKFNFSKLYSNCSNLLDVRNLQEKVKKALCYQKLICPFTVWINCSSDCKTFAKSRRSAWITKVFLNNYNNFFLTAGQNNFRSKIVKIRIRSFGIGCRIRWVKMQLVK